MQEPALTRLCIVEVLGAGERVLQRRSQLLAEAADFVDRGRLATSATCTPPEITAEAVSVTDLLGPLMSVIVLPCLGAGPAGRELNRPPIPRVRHARGPARSKDALDDLDVRLNYRTVRALMALVEHPRASRGSRNHGGRVGCTLQRTSYRAIRVGLMRGLVTLAETAVPDGDYSVDEEAFKSNYLSNRRR